MSLSPLNHQDITKVVHRLSFCSLSGCQPICLPAGPGGPGLGPQRSGSSPSYQSHKMSLPQYPPSGHPNSQYYKVRGCDEEHVVGGS